MSYCFNPACPDPQNPEDREACLYCGATLRLQNRYRLLKLIGQGGFGRTFLASDESLPSQPRCVIKQLFVRGAVAHPQKLTERFEQEALRLEELGKHSQIPELLNFFEQDGQQYLVQELIAGQNLEQELAESGAFSEGQICQLLREILSVLQFVHDHQVIHRDIKPANIIRRHCRTVSSGEEQLVLVDFGAAKLATDIYLERTGTIIGSAEYIAPEQIKGRAIFASDLYSLGVTCIHLLTQISPFDLFDSRENVWVWRDYLLTPVSESLGRILDNLLHSATKRRYQTASEVLQDLDAEGTQTATESPLENGVSPQLRRLVPPGFSATVFAPQTQSWHWIDNRHKESADMAWAVASFLSARLAAAAATPPVNEEIPQRVPYRGSSRPENRTNLTQKLRERTSRLFGTKENNPVEFVFNIIVFFIVTHMGAALMICFFAAMERNFPVPQTEIQRSQFPFSNGLVK
ncbi:MAG: protein kinase domain-containing protein [Microcystaceae cyanobacterium]